MTKQKFEFLCRKVLVPEINKALRRHTASRQLVLALTSAVDRHFANLWTAMKGELTPIRAQLDELRQFARK